MSSEKDKQDVRDWQLERYLLGELPHEESEVVRRTLGDREDLRVRLAALERSNLEILVDHPPSAVASQVRARLVAVRKRSTRARATLALAASLALVVASGAVLHTMRRAAGNGKDVTRVKGLAPQLLLFRKVPASGVERLPEGGAARDHDLLQVAYQATGRRYGVILSIDSRGVVTRHLPAEGGQAATLKSGPPVPLPQAFELDDAPGFERFYFVTSDEPFPLEAVVSAVRQWHASAAGTGGGRLDLPASMDQVSFVLSKESSR